MLNFTNFIDYIDTEIRVQMMLGYNQDQMRLTGLRNIKSDYNYIHSKDTKKSEVEILKSMYKEREENSHNYTIGSELYLQEITEMNILNPFIPTEPSDNEVQAFLNTLDIEKSKKNFKKFQDACENHFGQKVNSQLILNFINS